MNRTSRATRAAVPANRQRATRRRVLGAAASLGLMLAGGQAFAQASDCGQLQKMLVERKRLADNLTAQTKGKKNIDAGVACTGFTKLVGNGNAILKWASANKDWCQVPDSFVSSVKTDHTNATAIRAKACTFAAKQVEMLKKARENASSGAQSGLLGGGGLEGASRIPQGAL